MEALIGLIIALVIGAAGFMFGRERGKKDSLPFIDISKYDETAEEAKDAYAKAREEAKKRREKVSEEISNESKENIIKRFNDAFSKRPRKRNGDKRN